MTARVQGARARFSVDLGSLKAALIARARATGKAPAALLREALATALGPQVESADGPCSLLEPHGVRRVRMSLRMRPVEAMALTQAARQAGLGPAAYVAALVAGVPAARHDPSDGAGMARHREALMASSVQLASLARDLRMLTRLLTIGDVAAAQAYRASLDGAVAAIEGHLRAAGDVLADLMPRSSVSSTSKSAASARHRLAGKVRRPTRTQGNGQRRGGQ